MSLDTNELDLIRRTLDGDHDAFGTLVLIYEHPLLMYIYSILRNWESTHDVAQETFTAAYYALPRWKPPERRLMGDGKKPKLATSLEEQDYPEIHPLAPWLYRIATNNALTFLKKQTHQERTFAQVSVSSSRGDATPEELYLVRELLQEALGCLPEDDAMCITLRFGFGERYSEIATRLNLSKESVRKRIARGLLTLRSTYTRTTEREALL